MDVRERSHYPSEIKEDHEKQILVVETEEGNIEYKAEYEICPDCNGKGKYVNPAIDSHGLSSEDFDEDPDFREDYLSGIYDIVCCSCHGKRVILVPTNEKGKEAVARIIQEDRNYLMEVAAERHVCGYF